MMFKNNFNNITINGQKFDFTNDSNIVIKNGSVIVNGKVIQSNINNVKVIIEGNVNKIDCEGSVEVNGNCGKIDCGGSCKINGDVSGDIDAGGSVSCGKVIGNINAGGSIKYIK